MVILPRLNSGSRVDEVKRILGRALTEGRVKVGERFPSEREMASQLGVGRLVIREALRGLASTGLIEIKRGVNGGCFVREATADDVARSFSNLLRMARISLPDLLEVRLGLETAIITTAIERATQRDLNKLKKNVAQTKILAEGGSPVELKDRVHEFHTLLADATHNPLFSLLSVCLINIVNQYMTELKYTSIVSRSTIKEHEVIYGYVASRDVTGAIQSVCKHIKEDNGRVARRAARMNLPHIHYLPSL
jgi:GntR family transcriptional regulator, transcriptional repressor for pyruvate dehydrogenase complex